MVQWIQTQAACLHFFNGIAMLFPNILLRKSWMEGALTEETNG